MLFRDKIVIFDPSIDTDNLGDKLIIRKVNSVISEIFPKSSIIRFSTRKKLKDIDLKLIRDSKIQIVAGTNLLSSHMLIYKQWNISLKESKSFSNCILLGVGWWQYQLNPDFYTEFVLKNALSKKYLHAVRDTYTKDKLYSIGITNTLLTGCPTIWDLTKRHCNKIPMKKGKEVVFTLTDYKKNKFNDLQLIKILSEKYEKLYFWPQGKEDLEYLKKLVNIPDKNITILPRNLESFKKILKKKNLDYVGTRLHAGIIALQNKKRTIIISIDNRAEEMKKDFNLPCIKRKDIKALSKIIDNPLKVNIKLPIISIKKWRSQFKKLK